MSAIRASCKGQLTKLKNSLTKLLDNPGYLQDPNTVPELKNYMEIIEKLEKRFIDVQSKIIEEAGSEQQVQEQEELTAFLDECGNTSFSVSRTLAIVKQQQDESQASDSSQFMAIIAQQLEEQKQQRAFDQQRFESLFQSQFLENNPAANSSAIHPQSTLPSVAKLESLSPPIFSGVYTEWKSFEDMFVSLIHNNARLSKSLKMFFLKKSLTGEALQTIAHLSIAEHYDAAWQMIRDRYDDNTRIVNSHIEAFIKQPRVTNPSANNLRNLYTNSTSILQAIEALKVSQRDPWLIYIIRDKLDTESQVLWAREVGDKMPTWDDFMEFLKKRCKAQELCPPSVQRVNSYPENMKMSKKSRSEKPHASAFVASKSQEPCPNCKKTGHKLYQCRDFMALSSSKRLELVTKLKICQNCVSDTHNIASCSYFPCTWCNKKHNKLLHDAFSNIDDEKRNEPSTSSMENSKKESSKKNESSSKERETKSSLTCVEEQKHNSSQVLLATARVRILDKGSNVHLCRAILDAGSQVNLITSNLCQKLSLPLQSAEYILEGVGSASHATHHKATVQIQIDKNHSSEIVSLDCLVMKKIAGNQPCQDINDQSLAIPPNVILADPEWNKSAPIDLLIGGELFWHLFHDGTHIIAPNAPLLKSSVFGWLVVGPYSTASERSSTRVSCNLSTLASIESTLKKFWEIEEVPKIHDMTIEHKEVEELFSATTTRDEDGRYVVCLPRNDNIQKLQNNRPSATKQFTYMERRFDKNAELKREYSKVFTEYLQLNIIEVVPHEELDNPSFYLPHHCVIKEESITTKLRIVFNASAKSQSGLSLNDCLKAGPVIQPKLVLILWRFRLHRCALTCDITKMYLQTMIHPNDRDYQRFVWREEYSEPIKHYRFRTICFGVTSSPFLAIRALMQLAEDEEENYPLASAAIKSNFYVDDCLISVPDETTLVETKNQLIQIMQSAGIQLTKFKSNCIKVLDNAESNISTDKKSVPNDEIVKTLGMYWDPKYDTFQYKVTRDFPSINVTRRQIASTAAKIFDPLGVIGPIVTKAKLLIQDSWRCTKKWDDPVSENVQVKWNTFTEELPQLEELRIPRWASNIESPSSMELHVFSDASASAYGAAVYLVCENSEDQRSSRLLTSKSKIMPLKPEGENPPQEITIPKAELCGALMAAELIDVVSKSLEITKIYCWTDATIVLHQIHSPSEKKEVFVKKRVNQILKFTKADFWRHVPTKENPADILSRGASPHQIMTSELWWNGPSWLLQSQESWPQKFQNSLISQSSQEIIKVSSVNITIPLNEDKSIYTTLLSNISEYRRMQRTLAYLLRARSIFKKNLHCSSSEPHSGPLMVEEIQAAENLLIKWDQETHLRHVFNAIKNETLNTDPKLKLIRRLKPFVDDKGLLRIGGRLDNSHEPYNTRHPQILPKGPLAILIAKRFHTDMLHAGSQLLLAGMRQKYWPLGGRNLTRKIVKNCIPCIKAHPPNQNQIMGDLPVQRVTHTQAFKSTGVDFAGPLNLKSGQRKGSTTKAYIAVFVCMSTKAIHLELVSSLNTEAFIATLRRFVARRGIPFHIFSDNGTTFIGADREIKKLFKSSQVQEEITNFLSTLEVKWCFQPPKAPHHGGLWEAAVRSCKHHLKRILGQTTLNFEEMTTVLYQIEAVLNSRPIIPVSSDVNDPSYITPGHFLVGAPLTQLPDPNLEHLPINRLSKWQLCQKIQQDFAKRWKKEYLHSLQMRTKWSQDKENLKINDSVLFVDEQMPSTLWPLGIVTDIFQGKDGKIRVVNVKTSKGIFKRPITKIVKLPTTE